MITVEGLGLQNELEVVEGMQFDRGYLSPYFINNQANQTAEARKSVHPAVRQEGLERPRDAAAARGHREAGRPLLVVAEDIEGEARDAGRQHDPRHRPSRASSPQTSATAARPCCRTSILTGGTVISDEVGLSLEKATLADMGQAKKIVVEKENTTIIDGNGKTAEIKGRISQINSRSRKPPPTTTRRSCRSAWRSSPAASP